MLNSYKWLQIDWPQRLGSWMCTVINSIYYSNQCGTTQVENNSVDVNATSTRRVQSQVDFSQLGKIGLLE